MARKQLQGQRARHRVFPTRFTLLTKSLNGGAPYDLDEHDEAAEITEIINQAEAKALAARDLPRELVGTSFDPFTVDGDPLPATKSVLDAHKKAITRARRARPIQIASFEV
jgi:hypothetical protein